MNEKQIIMDFLAFVAEYDIKLRQEGDDYIGDEEIHISTFDEITPIYLDELLDEFLKRGK